MPNKSDQEFLVLLLQDKHDALTDADCALTKALADPANDRTAIEQQLGMDKLERKLLLDKIDEANRGVALHFPTDADVRNLKQAVQSLESAVQSSAEVDTLIRAAATVAKSVGAANL